MITPAPSPLVQRTVQRLRGTRGLSDSHLTAAAVAVIAQGLPPRDGLVLAEARARAAIDTPRARAAWQLVREGLASAMPEATYRLWIDPLRVVGEREDVLLITGPKRLVTWVERRYLHLAEHFLPPDWVGMRVVRPGECVRGAAR